LVAKGEAALAFQPGNHAATFGGNPLATAAALATLSVLLEENLAACAQEKGTYMMEWFCGLQKKQTIIKEVRGLGLMLGIELTVDGKPVLEKCLEEGLLVNFVHGNVLRLVPALNISYEEIDLALHIIAKALNIPEV
jgi:acetylornithine/succinyldiaminopimelate/putrescine aminotransferase